MGTFHTGGLSILRTTVLAYCMLDLIFGYPGTRGHAMPESMQCPLWVLLITGPVAGHPF